ncbi:MAG: aldo/keto reductase [Clostridia bacterium]|nr:aldo/keto reductase [Clostridia bacterium]
MSYVTLGSTGIKVIKNGFGALPIQRDTTQDAVAILRRAYEGGIRFYDTARFYTDSEEKIGIAFEKIRDKVFIASKTAAENVDDFKKDLNTTLKNLRTDYLDLYQFHNLPFVPKPGNELYSAMEEAKKEGKIRHIGMTNHRLNLAWEIIECGGYETLQFPFSYLAGEQEKELVNACKKHNMGFIAMKALAGGLINNSAAAYAYLDQFDNVLPIWGVQRMNELEEFLSYNENPPKMTDEITDVIERDRKELAGDFCRGCGYCMPCPAGIEINNMARMSLLLRRSPSQLQLTEEVQKKMEKVKDCMNCGRCKSKCPYGLDTPALLRKNYEDYINVVNGKTLV